MIPANGVIRMLNNGLQKAAILRSNNLVLVRIVTAGLQAAAVLNANLHHIKKNWFIIAAKKLSQQKKKIVYKRPIMARLSNMFP